MKTRRIKSGLTLLETVIAVAIIATLASIVITALTRIDTSAKEQHCEATLETINAALRQYRDYEYPCRNQDSTDEGYFYRALKFPPDCNDFQIDAIKKMIDDVMRLTGTTIDNVPGSYDDKESGVAVMCFFLNSVVECRQSLEGIDKNLMVNDHDGDGQYMTVTIPSGSGNREYPWFRIIDPWGMPLRYDYYDETESFNNRGETIRNFPLITSAGPDGQFDTADDIHNRIKTITPTQN